jgi:hypothetical protein
VRRVTQLVHPKDPQSNREDLSANKRNRWSDVVIAWNQNEKKHNAHDGTDRGGQKKTLLRVKSGKKVLEKCRHEERNQAQA